MVLTRAKTAGLCIAVLVVLAGGCTSKGTPATPPSSASTTPATSSASSSTAPGTAWSVVAVGDSVPSGTACHCTPYPQLSAADLSLPGLREIAADNLAVPAYTTGDALRQLSDDDRAIVDMKDADVVEIEIGANDVGYVAQCGTNASCYTPKIGRMEQNLRTIVQRARQLTAGHPAIVVLLDYWAVWLGGKYAQAKGEAYVDAAATVTDDVDTAIEAVAMQTDSAYVDLRAAFKGPGYGDDETHYLASDGDHPNAAGHRKIAAALNQVIRARLDLPSS